MADGDVSFKLLDWLWAIVVPLVGLVWKQNDMKIQDMKKEMDGKIAAVASETERNRDVSAKIFDKLDQMSRESAERHISLLSVIHTGLAGKVDK